MSNDNNSQVRLTNTNPRKMSSYNEDDKPVCVSSQCIAKLPMSDKEKVHISNESNSPLKRKQSMKEKDKIEIKNSEVSTKGNAVRTRKNKKKNYLRENKVLDPNMEQPYFVCGEGCDYSFGYYDSRCFDCCKNRRLILAKCKDCSTLDNYGTRCECNGRVTYHINIVENIEIKEYLEDTSENSH